MPYVQRRESGQKITSTRVVIATALLLLLLARTSRAEVDEVSLDSLREIARRLATRNTMHAIENALVQWQTESDLPCPPTLDVLVVRKILNNKPLDAWNHPFKMKCPGDQGREVDLISLGRDGKLGSIDDLRSWEEEPDIRFETKLSPGIFLSIEQWRVDNGIETRSEAIRRLFLAGAKALESSTKSPGRHP